jgi:hypothetical protein
MRFFSFGLDLVAFLLLAGCASAPPVSASRYKLYVSSDGLYRVSSASLQSAGIDVGKIDPNTLQLFRGDREVALRVQGQKDTLTFEFYGQAPITGYSPFNVYWLRWGVERGKRMPSVELGKANSPPIESFDDTVRFAHPTLYIPNSGDSWFWQSLTAPISVTVPLTLPAALSTPAALRVNLWGSTEAPQTPNHHLTVFFNNMRVADDRWGGQGAHVITATLPANTVRAGENALRLAAPGDTGVLADVVLLSSIVVTYTRQFIASPSADALYFPVNAGTYRVEGFSGDAIQLYDVTDPLEPAFAVGATAAVRALVFQTDAQSTRRYLAVGPKGYKSPERIVPMPASDLRSSSHRADYIVITDPSFVDALKPLVQWREQHGLQVTEVTTDEIYNEFNDGNESPLAIRAFIDWAWREWARPAPRFVLLVGKASYDYLDYLNGPNQNLVPTFLVPTPSLGHAASDNWFVAPDESNGRPALAIGRIPAKTPEQVARAVSKTISFESAGSADWRRRALFVADDKDPAFNAMVDTLAGAAPGMQVHKLLLSSHKGDVNSTRAELLENWNAGDLLVTYIGHGSIDTWAAGPLFSTQNLSELKNGDRLSILFTPTCLDGFFYHPQVDSLAEDLLFKGDGGIVAGLVPTGLSLPQAQDELMRGLFGELFAGSDVTLGEAIMRAKQKMPDASPDMREVIDTFGLLGDPALRFPGGS